MYLHGHSGSVRDFKLAQKKLVLEGLIGVIVVIIEPYLAESNALGMSKQSFYFIEVTLSVFLQLGRVETCGEIYHRIPFGKLCSALG